jgi:hypothetical protein
VKKYEQEHERVVMGAGGREKRRCCRREAGERERVAHHGDGSIEGGDDDSREEGRSARGRGGRECRGGAIFSPARVEPRFFHLFFGHVLISPSTPVCYAGPHSHTGPEVIHICT